MKSLPTFALLDDASASDSTRSSRCYSDLLEIVACMRAEDVASCFEHIDRALANGAHAVGLFDYELGHALHPRTGSVPDAQTGRPLFSVLLFSRCERLDASQVQHRLAGLAGAGSTPCGVANLRANVEASDYFAAVERIRRYIAAGDTYQVNYTYKLKFDTFGDPVALYLALRARVLAQDEKNRAENLMIVDLLRNDLGRLAKLGTVRVPTLFSVDRYGVVLQMTSTVTAAIDRPRGLYDYFQDLFPCGSITGAPKIRTMQIIRELEAEPRGLYTGAIGWFEPADLRDSNGCGPDFCLSVPIRTLVLDAAGRGEMGIGSGIVHESDPAAEYDECQLKAQFLTGLTPDFSLIESLYCEPGCGYRHLGLHLDRLARSAACFGFRYDCAQIRDALEAHQHTLAPGSAYKTRLLLHPSGQTEIDSSPIVPLTQPVRVLLSDTVTDSRDLLLGHKTTARALYNAEWKRAERQNCFDALCSNERGELTEGTRSNVFLQINGLLYTPPLVCGLLDGVMRRVVLDDATYAARERVLRHDDLLRAERILLTNAVRGVIEAKLVAPS